MIMLERFLEEYRKKTKVLEVFHDSKRRETYLILKQNTEDGKSGGA